MEERGPIFERECTLERPFECKLCEVQTSCDAASYTVNAGGTVTSSCCGFVWQQEVAWVLDPANPHDACRDEPGAAGCYTFDEANAYCAGLTLAGGGWRLPSAMELYSLIERDVPTGSRFEPSAFPSAPTGDRYWSSSLSDDSPNEAWLVGFQHTPPSARDQKDREHFARCVR